MKNSSLGKSLFLAVLCISAVSAEAGSSTTYNPFGNGSEAEHGYYLGGSVGTTKANDFCADLNNCDDNTKGWKVFGGYHLTDSLVLEGGYADLGELGQQPSDPEASSKISGYTGSLLATYPVQEKIKLFGKAGIFKQKSNDTNSNYTDNIKPVYGLGADYEIAEGIAIRGEWENYKDISSENNDETSDIQMLSLGMTFSSL